MTTRWQTRVRHTHKLKKKHLSNTRNSLNWWNDIDNRNMSEHQEKVKATKNTLFVDFSGRAVDSANLWFRDHVNWNMWIHTLLKLMPFIAPFILPSLVNILCSSFGLFSLFYQNAFQWHCLMSIYDHLKNNQIPGER